MPLQFRRDAGPGVAHGDQPVAAGRHARIGECGTLVQIDRFHGNVDRAAVRHRVARVDDQIHQHLLDLARLDPHVRRRARGVDAQLDVVGEPLQHAVDAAHDGVQIEPLRLERLPAAEGEELARQVRAALGRFLNLLGVQARRVAGLEAHRQQLGAAENRGQHVVEIVRHAPREASHRLHFLGLAELLFKGALGGDVLDDPFEAAHAVVEVDHAGRDAYDDRRAVLALPVDVDARRADAAAAVPLDELRAFGGRSIDRAHVERHQFLHRIVAEQRRERGIRVEDRAVDGGPIDAVRGALDEGSIARFGSPKLLLDGLLAGDVARDRLDADNGVALVHELHVLAQPDRVALLGDGGELEVRVRRALDELPHVQFVGSSAVVAADERHEVAAQEFAFVVLHHARGRRIHIGEAAVGVAVINDVLRVLDKIAQALFARAQRVFDAGPFAHVKRSAYFITADRAACAPTP